MKEIKKTRRRPPQGESLHKPGERKSCLVRAAHKSFSSFRQFFLTDTEMDLCDKRVYKSVPAVRVCIISGCDYAPPLLVSKSG